MCVHVYALLTVASYKSAPRYKHNNYEYNRTKESFSKPCYYKVHNLVMAILCEDI